MDPMTALSLAASIVQFIDYSTKLVDAACDIHRSASGTSLENQNIEFVVSELNALSLRLAPPSTGQPTDDEQALCRLAAECRSLSGQILGLLEKIKPKTPKSKRQSVWSAIKTMWNDREMKDLVQRLQSCRSQLELQLNFLTRSDTKAKLEALAQSAEEDVARLELLQKHVNELRQGVTVTSMSPEFHSLLRDLWETASEGHKQEQILRALAFSDMYGRFEDVEPAHFETFEWIFDEAYDGNVDDDAKPVDNVNDRGESPKGDSNSEAATNSLQAGDDNSESEENNDSTMESEVEGNTRSRDIEHDYSVREPFLHWLSAGNGVFHISGKLGSGKSTLMKFLCDHKRTTTELQKWAGQRKLVFTKFFLWKPGSELQRSLSGLFRCLLHDALRKCPELIPKVFPDQWNQLSTPSTKMGADLRLRNSEIREGFSRLIEHRNLYEKHCFCFFIDGLDEYEETRQEDYKALVDLLCGWTDAAPDDVKICVSSREYNVFLNSLSADKRLRLQDLTEADMERYIRNRLGRLDDKIASDLVDTILIKASGIFLWVALVVKSLRERLEETQDLSILKEEIDVLPDELEDLFQYLLNTLSKTARTMAYKTFAMLEALASSSDAPPSLSLFAYSFLEDYSKCPEFAIQTPFQYVSMSPEAKKTREDQGRKTLVGSTKGLVEAIQGSIKHIHRSIPEFLESRGIQDEMAFCIQDFEAADAVSQLLVAELRAEAYISGTFNRRRCSFLVSCIIVMRTKFGVDRAPYSFLESLGSVLIEHGGPDTAQFSVKGIIIESRIWETHFSAFVFDIQHRQPETNEIRSFEVISPFHISALFGLEEYVTWKIRHDQSILNTDFETALLVSIMGVRIFSHSHRTKPTSTQILESLLEQGLSPQAVVHTSRRGLSVWADNDRTFWEHFVLLCALQARNYTNFDNKILVGKAIEKFLEYGADPSLWLSASSPCFQIDDKGFDTDLEIKVGRNGRKILFHLDTRTVSVHPLFTKVGGVSFREYVEYWDFDNKESLLGLIDKNIKQQEERIGEDTSQEQQTWKHNTESILTRASSLKPMKTRLWRCNTWFASIKTSHIVTFGLGLFVAAVVPHLWVKIVKYKLNRRY